ncbi:hypothetical protein MRB53_008500 [Persea americana]|uniref:Uncharacterized protein n=1 Tax=Persea americana TaxID=3435 RepID=A0ACC2MLV2_PERAE|nr:hypothetical protein MRB53_008500 [Persea americana]
MAATAPNTFILSNIHHLVPTKLNGGNYILWKSLFEPILRAHSLLGFIDGTNPCPSKYLPQSDGSSCTTPNTKYLEWIQQDQHLITWINSTLSETVLPYVVGLSTSKSIWDALSKRYSSLSRSHVLQLKNQLQHIKKGSLSMQDYLQQIKMLTDKLAMSGSPVSEEDSILYTLNGLPTQYRPFQTSIRTRSASDPVSIDELHALLVCEELSLGDESLPATTESSTAFSVTNITTASSRGLGHSHGGRGSRYRGRGRGRYQGPQQYQQAPQQGVPPPQNSSRQAPLPACQYNLLMTTQFLVALFQDGFPGLINMPINVAFYKRLVTQLPSQVSLYPPMASNFITNQTRHYHSR